MTKLAYGEGLSAKIAKSIKPSYYENYYAMGVPLNSTTAYWNTENFVCGLKEFIKVEKGKTTFLDMGAGTGAIVKLVRDYGLLADGYELNRYALENAEVELIERDITEPFLKEYDIVYSNAFMYFSEEDFKKFFTNNRDKFKVLVLVYPFDGNNDRYRVNLKTREMFIEMAETYGLNTYSKEDGWLIMVRKEDANDLPFGK